MINERYIPTALTQKSQQAEVQIVDRLQRPRSLVFYIISQFSTYFLRILLRQLSGKPDPKQTAVELREIFENLGGLWIKVAQLLAMRTDVFSEEICQELIKLQFAAVGFPFEQVRSTIETELGAPIPNLFEIFEEKPIAAASIAQVHRAWLDDETPVVVKVQRPGVQENFQKDLELIGAVINTLRFLNIANYLALDEAYEEVKNIFQEEVDYRYEAANLRRMKKSLKNHKIYVPKVYGRLSRSKVLVMEYVDGVLMSEYIKVNRQNPRQLEAWLTENNIDIEVVGERLLVSIIRQIFEDNLYHADLHPGNIILLRDSKFVLIDFGSVGSLQKELRMAYINYVTAAGAGNFPKAADYFLRLASADIPKINVPRVRTEIARGLTRWEARTQVKDLKYEEKSLASSANDIGPVTAEYQIPISWEFLKITRSIGTLDTSLKYLAPNMNAKKVLGKYFRKAEIRRFRANLAPMNVLILLREIVETVREYNSLVLPQLRQRTLPFGGINAVNKFALGLARIGRTLAAIVLIAGLGLFYAFLAQQHWGIVEWINTPLIDQFLAQWPSLSYIEWFFIFVVVGLVWKTLLDFATILERQNFPQ